MTNVSFPLQFFMENDESVSYCIVLVLVSELCVFTFERGYILDFPGMI